MIIFLEIRIELNTIQCVDGFYDGSCLIFYLFRPPLHCIHLPQTKAIRWGNITELPAYIAPLAVLLLVMADTRFVSKKPLTFDCDLDLSRGILNFVCDTPRFILSFCEV